MRSLSVILVVGGLSTLCYSVPQTTRWRPRFLAGNYYGSTEDDEAMRPLRNTINRRAYVRNKTPLMFMNDYGLNGENSRKVIH